MGRAYLDFALSHPEAYKLMFDIKQPNEAAHPELVAAGERSRATMTAHLKSMIDNGVLKGDPDLIGHMFWSALHGAIQLQLAGMLSPPFDAERLSAEIMRTLSDRNAEPTRTQGQAASNAPPLGSSPSGSSGGALAQRWQDQA